MRYISLLLLLIIRVSIVYATDIKPDYAKTAIPSDLLKDANAVVRVFEQTFTVHSTSRATSKEKLAITILNQKGIEHATKVVFYNKLSKVNAFSAKLYDEQGKLVKKLKSKDILDHSATSQINLYDDSRVKVATFRTYDQFPFTVEFEVEETTSNMMFYPVWVPQFGEYLSVQSAILQMSIPAPLKLRYKEQHITQKAEIINTESAELYTWKVNNLKVIEKEPFGPDFIDICPLVWTAPSEFSVQGYEGTMNTWTELGLWQNRLNEGRDVLPVATVEKLKKLVEKEPNPEAKVKKIYEYLQANTRYISIQVGIGGWQPFEASFVDSKGYGDCKALTNYTQAMLKSVGITSYHADIRAGKDERDIMADFSSQQANHVILCVPLEKDTMWLECTSQQAPAGYLGSFTSDRNTMLVTPRGGKLVRTPAYRAEDNKQFTKAEVYLDPKGKATVKSTEFSTGVQQETLRYLMDNASAEDKKKWLFKNIDLPDFEINNFEFNGIKDKIPSVTLQLNLTVGNCATVNGKRMFIKPNLLNKISSIPAKVENRKYDIIIKTAFLDRDTIVYSIPEGYQVEFKPDETTIVSPFGKYQSRIEVQNNLITYIREFTMPKGRYSSSAYSDFIEFKKKIVKADAAQVVLVAKDGPVVTGSVSNK